MGGTITISREEYDRLRAAAEDLSDIEAYDRAMREGGEGLPHAYMRRIVAGEDPLRVFREWRGMTGAELGRAAGVHRVVVHEIETGKKRGSIDTIRRLADALGVTVDDLI